MNYLLKIVDGPNKGAEIALVEGVAVTLGKGDECDIVLADATMPDAPVNLEATPGGVLLDGSMIEPCHVKKLGATSFAVGPGDAPWGELVWPKEEVEAEEREAGNEIAETKDVGEEARKPAPDAGEQPKPKKKSGCLGCLAAVAVLLLIVAVLCWFFRGRIRSYAENAWGRNPNVSELTGETGVSPAVAPSAAIESIAAKYGLSMTNRVNGPLLSGNLATRAERLAATAEAYSSQPGVALDLSDDESFRAAAEDALFTLAEGRLKVSAATNRCLVIKGSAPSPTALARTLEALNSDMPKLRNVDVTQVSVRGDAALPPPAVGGKKPVFGSVRPASAERNSDEQPKVPSFPVCGILTTPYRCLVLQNGMRLMEGGAIGDNVILKIDADSVTVTNSAGRFTWRP